MINSSAWYEQSFYMYLRSCSLCVSPPPPRRFLPEKARHKRQALQDMTRPLKLWLYRHRENPYPSKSEKLELVKTSQMSLTQVQSQHALVYSPPPAHSFNYPQRTRIYSSLLLLLLLLLLPFFFFFFFFFFYICSPSIFASFFLFFFFFFCSIGEKDKCSLLKNLRI